MPVTPRGGGGTVQTHWLSPQGTGPAAHPPGRIPTATRRRPSGKPKAGHGRAAGVQASPPPLPLRRSCPQDDGRASPEPSSVSTGVSAWPAHSSHTDTAATWGCGLPTRPLLKPPGGGRAGHAPVGTELGPEPQEREERPSGRAGRPEEDFQPPDRVTALTRRGPALPGRGWREPRCDPGHSTRPRRAPGPRP